MVGGRTEVTAGDGGRRLVLCLITDRRRLAAAVGEPETSWERLLLEQIRGAMQGGVDVIQIRERDLNAGILAAFVRQAVVEVACSSVQIVVNDRLDVALASGAQGLHLREDSVPTSSARRLLGGSQLLGRSVHTVEGLRTAGPVDYLIAGSVFPTASKTNPTLGLDGLRALVEQAGDRPVWAIGGITAEQLGPVARAGARGAAGIGSFIPTEPSSNLAASVQKLTATLRFCFDSSTGLS